MSVIEFTRQDFDSLSENVARVKLSNMYTVDNPLSLSGHSYIPRPTLGAYKTLPSGSIRGIWYQSSQGSTLLYVVSGETLYKIDPETDIVTSVGSIPGADFCTFASTIYSIAIVASGKLFLFNGAVLTDVSIPDNNLATDVTSLDNYFIIGIKDTNRYYWINPGDLTIHPLSFASAERNPDDIVSVMSLGDELWVLGQSTAEVFVDSGDINAPFIRISGRVYQTGCADKLTVVNTLKETLPCLIWVTPSKEVVLAQGSPIKISDESVEEVLKRSSVFTAWAFRTNRHDFYVLSTDVATFVFDITAGVWCRWSTYLKDTWDAVAGIHVNDTVYCVTNFDGSLYKLSYNTTDANQDYLVCEVSGFVPQNSIKPVLCNNVTLFLNYGFSGSYLTSPTIELRWSDDGGHTWVNYMQAATGSRGLYDTNVSFRSLGRIVQPGRLFEVRFSELQSFRFDGATYND